jgi:hypothetical protein
MGFLKSVADWVRANVPLVGGYIADAVEWIEDRVSSWLQPVWDFYYAAKNFFDQLWISLTEAGRRFSKIVQDLWWKLYTFFVDLWTTVYNFFTWLWDSFRNWASDWINRFIDFINYVWPGFRDLLNNLGNAWNSFVRDPWGTIRKAIDNIWSEVYVRAKPFLDELGKRVTDAQNQLMDRINYVKNALDGARSDLEARINNLDTWARNKFTQLGNDFDQFKTNATNWINNVKTGLEDLSKNFWENVRTSIVIWEAAKGAARKRVATEVADVIEKPEVQQTLMGGELAAFVANTALGAALTGVVIGLENWSIWMSEKPIELPIESDNPLIKDFFSDVTVEFEGPTEFTFGELLAQAPALEYEWPDVNKGEYEPKIVGGE